MNEDREATSDSWSERLYDVVVRLYPRQFRQAYGASMKQVFREMLADQNEPAWRVWLTVLADVPRSVVSEYLSGYRGGKGMQIQQLIHNPIVRQGAIAGLLLGLAHAIYAVINNGMNLDARGNALLNNGLTAALVLAFGSAGFAGSRRARTLRAGTYTGVCTAAVSSIIGIAALWIATAVFFDNIRHNTFMVEDFHRSGAQSMDAFIIDDALGATFFGTLLALTLGMVMGAIGGLLGKVTSQFRPS